jgi:hypothetical protein
MMRAPAGHYDGPTLRDFLHDLMGAASAGMFVWCVCTWAPYFAR